MYTLSPIAVGSCYPAHLHSCAQGILAICSTIKDAHEQLCFFKIKTKDRRIGDEVVLKNLAQCT